MSSPQVPFKVKALSPYQARNDTEVSLTVGTEYTVYQTDGKGLWWQTKNNNGKPGWFPASYTQVVTGGQETPRSEPPKVTPQPQPKVQEQPKPETGRQQTSKPEPPKQVEKKDEEIKMTVKTVQISNKTEGSKEEVPPPSKPPKIEKGETNSYVLIQIVEAKNLKAVDGSESKTEPTAFLFRREILDDGKGKKLFQTSTIKKSVNPKWNEKFQINVNDAESEIIVIRFCSGNKPVMKGKSFLGEISFPLRGSVRDFDHPGYQFKFYPITGKSDKPPDPTGEVKIYIQYVNTKGSVGKPTDFKQVSHIGWSNDGGFDIQNIPPEWKQIFQKAGIKKRDLENNPELAKEVVSIMNTAHDEAKETGTQVSLTQEVKVVSAPPPPPPPSGGQLKISQAPPPPSGQIKTGPPPPPSGEKPPSGGGGGGDRGGLLDQIRTGTTLKRVEVNENRGSTGGGGGNTLLSTLQNALQNHRKDIEGDDEEDDWSNDGWGDEDE